jgi:hypothetical protein
MTDIRDVGAILISMVIHVIQFCAFQFHVTTEIIARTEQISDLVQKPAPLHSVS